MQSEQLYKTANEHHGFLKNADGKLSDLFNRLQQLENAVTQLSRSQVSFESSIQGRLEILEHDKTASHQLCNGRVERRGSLDEGRFV